MDSGSDVEPPPKVSKTEILTPSRAQKLKELHLSILAQYGINSEFEVSRPMDVVNNEVVCSSMALNVSKMDVFTKSLLGLDGNEQCDLSKFRRRLTWIENQHKINQRRNKDKSFEFFDRSMTEHSNFLDFFFLLLVSDSFPSLVQ
ncbi:Protein CBG11677 [Caenorhabditis briggsae]|uniref:Uncharacterized protein n=2 Tax=Caenorhabditis briggsae TaxID=6238 RepID=A0AAE9AF81_CAEBR|nr:Protein CBG11677 [Caenorhabditis briggsae]ULT93747.1 hypothetical protein L3Y34_003320 [Caenorhabditis briggsae]CAP30796.1 Protein CBG11677 [Caenorhabditis briggsae]